MTAATFEHVESYRSELKRHCYRMLGSAFDAEDAVQETLVRAWRSVKQFEGRTTLRGWLYSIATNVCLTMLEKSKRRRNTPFLAWAPATDYPGAIPTEVAWLEPYPTPDEEYELKEATELAFVAAIAYLPPKQRAALLLSDVLGWSANETARALQTTVASVNSALQRARETLRKKSSTAQAPHPSVDERELLGRYMHAWERKDMRSFAALLKDDAIFSMPPRPEWYQGRDRIHEFVEWALDQTGYTEIKMVPTRANSQPACMFYGRARASDPWEAHAIHVLTIEHDRIAVVHNFLNPALFSLFT